MAGDGTPLLWVGLGNPGSEYARHRHNVGFMAVEAIASRHRFSPWRKRFKGEIAEGSVGGRKVIALKPQTYMNDSGSSVQQAAAFSKIPVDGIWVFHDELDLAPGKVRVKKGGGVAGHNGLRDIRRAFGSPEFWRIRIGIGHPGHKDAVTGHVLGNFAKADQGWVSALLDALADAAPLLAEEKPEPFMTRVALLTQEA
jgi:peptidyl-tRNA hydrolase, PTH1 family